MSRYHCIYDVAPREQALPMHVHEIIQSRELFGCFGGFMSMVNPLLVLSS